MEPEACKAADPVDSPPDGDAKRARRDTLTAARREINEGERNLGPAPAIFLIF
jgi:hypothetical protein